MRIYLKLILVALAAGTVSSCYYDPYYSGYSSSYGISGGTTFIHTSSDRWLYDSSVRCYYDRHRRAYYDPWISGYYPVGYCPRPVYSVPHPYGWSGSGTCPVPRNVSYRTIDRHHDRLDHYRNRNYSWAQNARLRDISNESRWRENHLAAVRNYDPNKRQRIARPQQIDSDHSRHNWQPNLNNGRDHQAHNRQQALRQQQAQREQAQRIQNAQRAQQQRAAQERYNRQQNAARDFWQSGNKHNRNDSMNNLRQQQQQRARSAPAPQPRRQERAAPAPRVNHNQASKREAMKEMMNRIR